MTWDEAELMFPRCSVEWDMADVERKERFLLEVNLDLEDSPELWVCDMRPGVFGMPTPIWLRGLPRYWFRERWQWDGVSRWNRYWPIEHTIEQSLLARLVTDPPPQGY